MRRFIFLFLLIVAFSAAFPFLASAQTASTPCNQFQSGSTPPAGYGAAWNVLSSQREMLLNSFCRATEGERRVGTGNPNHYIYKYGYRYENGWKVTIFDGTSVSGSSDWLSGQAGNRYSLAGSVSTGTYLWVAYLCQWSGQWKCGCADAACSTTHWQLQGFAFPGSGSPGGTSGGTTGGSTGGTTGGTGVNELQRQYPGLYNETLPYMGLFYGLGYSGDQFLAAPIRSGSPYAARFRAERSGVLSHLSWHNRWEWPGSADGYSSGSGGSIYGELRADDGSSTHYPGALIARTEAYVPSQSGTNNFVELRFQSTPRIEAGKLYHIVFVQTASDYATINHSKTVNCTSPSGGPYYGNDFTMLFRESGGAWKEYGASSISKYSCAMGYVNLKYSDGVWVTAGGGWGSHRNQATIGGSTRGRQRFIVSGPTRRVDGVWLRIGRGGSAPLVVQVKNSSGSVLATKSEPASTFDAGSFTAEGGAVNWKHVAFPSVVALESGKEYSLELSSSGSYTAAGMMDIVEFGLVPPNHHHWSGAQAEISRNGGMTWQNWPDSVTSSADWIDLPLLFTLQGGPRSIQSVSAQ